MANDASNTIPQPARLEDYLNAFRARWALIAAAALIGLIVGSAVAGGRTATYTAETTVEVTPTPVGSTNTNLIRPNLITEREIVASDANSVAVVAAVKPGADVSEVQEALEVRFVPESEILQISFQSESALEAQAFSNAFASEYVNRRNSAVTEFYQSRLDSFVAQSDERVSQVADVEDLLTDLSVERSQVVGSLTLSDAQIAERLASIDARIQNGRSELAQLQALRRTSDTDAATATRNLQVSQTAARLLRSAAVPKDVDGISDGSIFGLAVGLSLILGAILSLVLDRLDKTAKTTADIASSLRTSVLASVPVFSRLPEALRRNTQPPMISKSTGARMSRTRESYRRLRSSFTFLAGVNDVRAVLVTSAFPAEGKTATSVNLALSIVQSGKTVALVSADMRRPSVESQLGIEESADGLSHFLAGLTDDISPMPVTEHEGLFVVPCGPRAGNPGELLGSDRFDMVVESLRERYDYVIVDTPPVTVAADAIAALTAVPYVIVVVDSQRTSSDELAEVRESIQQGGGQIVGAVLNRERSKSNFRLRNRSRYGAYHQ